MNLPNVSNAPAIWKSIMKSYDEACDVCLRTKSKGVGSTHKAPVFTEPGQCVSFDAWSVNVPHIHGGQQKVVRFKDLYSRSGRSYLISSESQSKDALYLYVAWAKSCGHAVKRFNSDNATVNVGVLGDTCRRACKELNIHFTTICPLVPRQNSTSETDFQTLPEDIRHELGKSKLPRSFWWYCSGNTARWFPTCFPGRAIRT